MTAARAVSPATPVPFDLLYAAAPEARRTDVRGGELPEALRDRYGDAIEVPLRSDRPTVIANFVSTLDGVVAFDTDWSSGGGEVSGFFEPDRFLMGLLRAVADAVLVGAGTVRAAPRHEWTPRHVNRGAAGALEAWRQTLGLAPQPTTIVVTSSGELDPRHPGLSAADVPVIAITTAAGRDRLVRYAGDQIAVEAIGDGPGIEPNAILDVAATHGLTLVLCEGGPHLFGDLLASGLVDELFLTIAPQIAGRDRDDPRLALVEGTAFSVADAPWATLVSGHRAGDHLFLRYRLRAGAPGSR